MRSYKLRDRHFRRGFRRGETPEPPRRKIEPSRERRQRVIELFHRTAEEGTSHAVVHGRR
jgi:hypothetical protein